MGRNVTHEMIGVAKRGRVLVQVGCLHPDFGNLIEHLYLCREIIHDGTTVGGPTRNFRHGPTSPPFPMCLCFGHGNQRFQKRYQMRRQCDFVKVRRTQGSDDRQIGHSQRTGWAGWCHLRRQGKGGIVVIDQIPRTVSEMWRTRL
eukprot:scaffold9526_cov247-Amphora_coffeaeformis.AAC.9